MLAKLVQWELEALSLPPVTAVTDGFTCLPLYKKAAAIKGLDVVFVMNYPAFFQFPSGSDTANASPGLRDPAHFRSAANGYTYSADEYYTVRNPLDGYYGVADPRNAIIEEQHIALRGHLGYPQDSGRATELMQMTFTAYVLAHSIWKNTVVDGDDEPDLIFCIGGINTYNGFPIHIYKNEIDVYNSIVFDIVTAMPSLIASFLKMIKNENANASDTVTANSKIRSGHPERIPTRVFLKPIVV